MGSLLPVIVLLVHPVGIATTTTISDGEKRQSPQSLQQSPKAGGEL